MSLRKLGRAISGDGGVGMKPSSTNIYPGVSRPQRLRLPRTERNHHARYRRLHHTSNRGSRGEIRIVDAQHTWATDNWTGSAANKKSSSAGSTAANGNAASLQLSNSLNILRPTLKALLRHPRIAGDCGRYDWPCHQFSADFRTCLGHRHGLVGFCYSIITDFMLSLRALGQWRCASIRRRVLCWWRPPPLRSCRGFWIASMGRGCIVHRISPHAHRGMYVSCWFDPRSWLAVQRANTVLSRTSLTLVSEAFCKHSGNSIIPQYHAIEEST